MNPRLIGGIDLQFRVMGGRRDHGPAFSRVFDDRNRKRRAFCRIRARSQFVEQHQRAVLTGIQDLHNVLHMCRKGGEILLDALLVADIGENMGEDRQRAAVRSRDMQPALIHG